MTIIYNDVILRNGINILILIMVIDLRICVAGHLLIIVDLIVDFAGYY